MFHSNGNDNTGVSNLDGGGLVDEFSSGPFSVRIFRSRHPWRDASHRITFTRQGRWAEMWGFYPEDIPHIVQLCESLAWTMTGMGEELSKEDLDRLCVYRELFEQAEALLKKKAVS